MGENAMRGPILPITPLLPAAIGVTALAGLAAGGYAYAAMWPGSRVFGTSLEAPKKPDEIALTFDDGPHPVWTPRLLEILARAEVRATFFLLGKYAVDQKPLVREMQAAGHLIGNHTWTHPNLARTGPAITREELRRTSGELEAILGERVRYFRPPFGGRSPFTFRIARELGMTPVLWNAMTSDWSAASVEAVSSRLMGMILKNQRRRLASNVVLHDGGDRSLDVDRSASVGAAGELLTRCVGTRFVRVDAWESRSLDQGFGEADSLRE